MFCQPLITGNCSKDLAARIEENSVGGLAKISLISTFGW
ncbi:MAG: hypothetical protein MRERC_2c089 [Mycoplasmataceae bacterium RC_NB112A]|nr:MAG: hypothetical protein MRERC_2c089 [Mycoplasmataceae bacterium RC_NB112A]